MLQKITYCIVPRNIIKLLEAENDEEKCVISKLVHLMCTWFERSQMDLIKICRFIAYFLMMEPPRHRFLTVELVE